MDLVDAYIAALESKDCGIRGAAAERLGGLGDTDAVPALERVVAQPKEKAILGLGSKDCGHAKAAVALEKLKPKGD